MWIDQAYVAAAGGWRCHGPGEELSTKCGGQHAGEIIHHVTGSQCASTALGEDAECQGIVNTSLTDGGNWYDS